jgi:hypothetical protein
MKPQRSGSYASDYVYSYANDMPTIMPRPHPTWLYTATPAMTPMNMFTTKHVATLHGYTLRLCP